MSQVDLIIAVQTLRSYNKALAGMNNDPESIQSWISRHAENPNRLREFPQDAAIGLLCFLGNPIYQYSNITTEQQEWSAIFGSAQQTINEEANWVNSQTSQNGLTTFIRLFGSDIQWVQQYAQSQQLSLTSPFEHFVNKIIDDFRTCQGNSGAGGINHTTYPIT
jgi:hypothetical protein